MPPKKVTAATGAKGKAKAVEKQEKKQAKNSKASAKGKAFMDNIPTSFFYNMCISMLV